MKGVLPWLVRRACRAGPRDLVSPVQNVFFLTLHYFNSFVQKAGQAAVQGHLGLLECVSASQKAMFYFGDGLAERAARLELADRS